MLAAKYIIGTTNLGSSNGLETAKLITAIRMIAKPTKVIGIVNIKFTTKLSYIAARINGALG
jgi:hypothetical protein